MTIQSNPTESNPASPLKKRIGPFPVWVWGAMAGGTFLVVLLLSRARAGSKTTETGDSENENPSTQDSSGVNTTYIQGEKGEKGEKGEQGEAGKTATAPARPECDVQGWTPLYNPNSNTWTKWGVYVSKPTTIAPLGKRWDWSPSGCRWQYFDIGQAAYGPSPFLRKETPVIDYSYGGEGGLSQQNVPAIGLMATDIASPTPTQRIGTTTQEAIPVMPHTPPRPLDRSYGRPFHG